MCLFYHILCLEVILDILWAKMLVYILRLIMSMPCSKPEGKQGPRSNSSGGRAQTDTQTDGRYQVHYLHALLKLRNR